MLKYFFYLIFILRFVESDNYAYLNESIYVSCKEKNCLLITSFKIPDNNSLNCVEDYLKIYFDYQYENKTIMQVEGFIIEGDSNIISSKQRFSKYCRKIRRYFFYNLNQVPLLFIF
jgi:hypothetical protein